MGKPNRAPDLDVLRIEAKLAGFVRAYSQDASNGTEDSRETALRLVCSGFEYLLGELLDGCDGWVDGVVPASDQFPGAVTILSHVEMSIRGRAIWAKAATGPNWIEPFFGSVRIAVDHDAVEAYEILFSNAQHGLGGTAYGKHIRRDSWYLPAEWGYRFTKPQ